MKQKEIEHAAKEWAENFDSYDPTFMGIKRMTAEISYRKGAEAVNERQPYSPKDMIVFLSWVQYNGFTFNSNSGVWISESIEFSGCAYNDDDLLKLWEESKK